MSRSLSLYYTLEELTGQKVVVSDLLRNLSRIPRSDVVRCVAVMSTLIDRDDSTGFYQQLRMLHEVIPQDLAAQIQEKLKNRDAPYGVFFHRRQLWLVLQMALLICKDDSTVTHDDATRKAVGQCFLMGNDLLKAIECGQVERCEDTGESLSFIMTALISYTDLSFGEEVIARAWQFWLDMQKEEPIRRRARNIGLDQTLDEAFEGTYGIPLCEFLLYITCLYVMLLKPKISAASEPAEIIGRSVPTLDSTSFFQGCFSQKHITNALKLLSAKPDDLAIRLLGSPRQSWATDSSPLARKPLLELAANRYVCPDPHMFRAFFIEGILELLMDAVKSEQLKQLLGDTFELYMEKLMRNFAPESSRLVNSYFHQVKFVGAGNQEACDGLLLWPSHAVLLEFKSGILTARQRYAMSQEETTKAIDDQIGKFPTDDRRVRKGVGQLAYNLRRMLKGEQVHCKGIRIDLSEVPKLYPAVVVYDEGMANHAVRLHLQSRMVEWFEKTEVDHSRIGHVLLLTIRDMEYFELLANSIGAERIMKEYVEYVEENPRDDSSMFHDYVLNRYPEAHQDLGFTLQAADQVFQNVKGEMEKRKALVGQ